MGFCPIIVTQNISEACVCSDIPLILVVDTWQTFIGTTLVIFNHRQKIWKSSFFSAKINVLNILIKQIYQKETGRQSPKREE